MKTKYLSSLANYGQPVVAMPNTPLTGADPIDFSALTAPGMFAASPQLKAPEAPSFWDGMIGTKNSPGWGGLALGGASALANAYFGMKQYGLAKKQLAEGKRQFDLNFAAQRSMTNSQLADRQNARVAANPGAYQSTADYMSQYGIKG
jgi:hypothetical protein